MAAPSGGIPKHSRILGILEIFQRTSPLDFQALGIRFSALKSVDLTEALKRALYRDIQELVAEGRLEELRLDSSGDQVVEDPDLEKIVAKSVWRPVRSSERFWGEMLLRENGIEISGSDFLVSEIYAQMDLAIKAEKFVHFAFGEQERLRVRIPKDLIPFTVYIGRSQETIQKRIGSGSQGNTNIIDQGAAQKARREIVITLPDPSISRKHCAIEFHRWNSVILSDLGSSNGTSAHFIEREVPVTDGHDYIATLPVDSSNQRGEWEREAIKAPTMSLAAYLGKILVTREKPLAIESRVHITCGVCRFLVVP